MAWKQGRSLVANKLVLRSVFLKRALCKVLATFPFSSWPRHNYSSISAQDQLITTVSIMNDNGPAGSTISGVKISCNYSLSPWQGTAEPPSRDSLGSRAASSCRSWARHSSFALQQCPHQPNDDVYWRQFLFDPSPAPHTSPLIGQPVPIRLNGNSSWMWPWAVPERWSYTHRQAPGHSSAPGPPALPVTQFHAGKLDYGSHWSTWFSASILLVKQWKRSSLSAMSAEAASYLPKSRAYLLGAPC